MAQNVTIAGASYSGVPSVDIPKTGGGTASFFDTSGVTAVAADVASGKYFMTAEGVLTAGTGSGGVDGDNLAYGNYVPAIVDQAIVGLSLVGEQTQPIVGTALTGLTVIGE